ncbi:MAG: hypothetical protein AAGA56_14115, partial [Myxococcota bacterium]
MVNGGTSPERDNVSVFINRDIPGTSASVWCSGTLLTPRLVAYSRACFAQLDTTSFLCGPDGEPIETGEGRGIIESEAEARELYVYHGTGPTPARSVDYLHRGVEIYNDGVPRLCSHDFGILALDFPIADAAVRPLLLHRPPDASTDIRVAGWGLLNSTDPASFVRRTSSETSILSVGPQFAANPPSGLMPRVFETPSVMCRRDTGMPAFETTPNDTGAILGIASLLVGNIGLCESTDSRTLFMQLHPWRQIIAGAAADHGDTLWYAGEPPPASVVDGGACTTSRSCTTSTCMFDVD